jgi:hypothetical protein
MLRHRAAAYARKRQPGSRVAARLRIDWQIVVTPHDHVLGIEQVMSHNFARWRERLPEPIRDFVSTAQWLAYAALEIIQN